MHYISVTITGHGLTYSDPGADNAVVEENADYGVQFEPDDHWKERKNLTVRFCFQGGDWIDVELDDEFKADIPYMVKTRTVSLGVYSDQGDGDLISTEPLVLPVRESIMTSSGTGKTPAYNATMGRILQELKAEQDALIGQLTDGSSAVLVETA